MCKKLFGENKKILPQNEGKLIPEYLYSKLSQAGGPGPPKGLGPYTAYMAKYTSMLWLKIVQQRLLQILLRTL
jgi:hypothetical protein